MANADDLKALIERRQMLKTSREKLEGIWREVSAIYGDIAWQSDATGQDTSREEPADATPQHAVNSYTRFLSSVLRPRGQKWIQPTFKRKALNKVPAARGYLDECGDIMLEGINAIPARFQKAARATDLALTRYGIGFMFIDQLKGRPGAPAFRAFHPKQCLIDVDENNTVNTVFRDFTAAPYQAVRLFGLENISPKVREAYDDPVKRFKEMCEYTHVVLPREEAERYGLKVPADAAFLGAYIDLKNVHTLMQDPFFEFPWVTPRQDVMPGTIYGYSIAMMSLGDSRMLQFIAEALTDASEYTLNPPLVAMDDAIIGDVRVGPNEITYIDPTNLRGATQRAIERLDLAGNIPVGLEHQLATRQQIMRHFLDDVFSLPDRSNMSATEIQRRNEDLARVIGPITDDLLPEYNGQIGERCFGMMMRNDQFPFGRRGPQQLQGEEIEFEYENPVTRLEGESKAAILGETLMTIIEMSVNAQRPDMLDNWDLDMVAREYPKLRDVEEKFLKPPEVVAEDRKKREEAQQAVDEMAGAEMAAQTGANIAEAAQVIDQAGAQAA